MRKSILLIATINIVFASAAFADQVTLKNGDRLTGTIVKSDAENLTLKSDLAGEVKIQWPGIAAMSSNQPLFITLKDGQVIIGTLATAGGRLEVSTTDAGSVAISKDAIASIRSREEQAAFLADVERSRHPRLGDVWTGVTDAGLSLSRGNSDTTAFNFSFLAARTTARDKLTVYATSLFARTRDKTTGESTTTAKDIRGGIRYDFNITDRIFAFGLSDMEHDRFQQLDLRLVLGGGLGVHVKKSEKTRFDLLGGGTLDQEYFTTGPNRRSGEVLVGEELFHALSKTTSFSERLMFYPNVSDLGDFRATFDATAVTSLTRLLNWQITLSDRYVSNPTPGVKGNDLLLSTGIRLTFGAQRK